MKRIILPQSKELTPEEWFDIKLNKKKVSIHNHDQSEYQIELLTRLKEEAVHNQDFELASVYRSQADEIRKERRRVAFGPSMIIKK